MPQVKICGVCRGGDASAAVTAGASCIGVVLAPGLPRTRTVTEAAAILEGVAVQRVGVFVDGAAAAVAAAALALRLDAVQLHGNEPPELVQRIRETGRYEVWKAVRLRRAADLAAAVTHYGSVVDALLLDGWSADAPGGSGTSFDWQGVAKERAALPAGVRLVVAGGLTADNVSAAVALLDPDIVDVSSGVEASIGIKSRERMDAFIAAARGGRGQ